MATVISNPLVSPRETSRLLASRIDLVARIDSSRVYASVPKSDNLENGFKDVTFVELARAVDKASWWLDSHLGNNHDPFEYFAYLGPRDLRYVVMIIAGIKTGRKVRPTASQVPSKTTWKR